MSLKIKYQRKEFLLNPNSWFSKFYLTKNKWEFFVPKTRTLCLAWKYLKSQSTTTIESLLHRPHLIRDTWTPSISFHSTGPYKPKFLQENYPQKLPYSQFAAQSSAKSQKITKVSLIKPPFPVISHPIAMQDISEPNTTFLFKDRCSKSDIY